MAPKDAAEMFVQRQRRSGLSSSSRSENKLGEIPLSAGEIEYLTRQDEAARRRQRLLHVREQEKRAAQRVTQRYRENLRRLQAQKLKLAQKDHLVRKEVLLSTLHEKYQLSLQGMGTAQRNAREKLIDLMEQAQVEQHKWAFNRRGEKLRYGDAVDTVRDDEAMRLARRREIEKNLERLKSMSEQQRSIASSRAKREMKLQLKLKHAQEEAERYRREHAETEEFSLPRTTPKDVTAYQFTRTHCVSFPNPARAEPGSARGATKASANIRQKSEVKVIRHNLNHPKQESAVKLAEQYRREMEKKIEEDWRRREDNERLANARGQEAHHALESRREGESAIQWLLSQNKIKRGAGEIGAHLHSEDGLIHDHRDLQSEAGTEAFAQLFGLEEDTNINKEIYRSSIRVLAKRCVGEDSSWEESSDVESDIKSVMSAESRKKADLSYLDAFHKPTEKLSRPIPTTTSSERAPHQSQPQPTTLRRDFTKESVQDDEVDVQNMPHARGEVYEQERQKEIEYPSPTSADVTMSGNQTGRKGDTTATSGKMHRRSSSTSSKNKNSSASSLHGDSASSDNFLLDGDFDWENNRVHNERPLMNWGSSVRPRRNNYFDPELKRSPASHLTTSERSLRSTTDCPPSDGGSQDRHHDDIHRFEPTRSTPFETTTEPWTRLTTHRRGSASSSSSSRGDSGASQSRELFDTSPEKWSVRSGEDDAEMHYFSSSSERRDEKANDNIPEPVHFIDNVDTEPPQLARDDENEIPGMQSLLPSPLRTDEENLDLSKTSVNDNAEHLDYMLPTSESGASRLAGHPGGTALKNEEQSDANMKSEHDQRRSGESDGGMRVSSLPIQAHGSRSSLNSDHEGLPVGSIAQYSLPLSDSFSSTSDSFYDHNADFEALTRKLIPIFPAHRRMSSASLTSVELPTRECAADVSPSITRGDTSVLLQGLVPQKTDSNDQDNSSKPSHANMSVEPPLMPEGQDANSDYHKQGSLSHQRPVDHLTRGALNDLSFSSDSSSDMSAYIYLTRMRELSALHGHTRGGGNPTQHNLSDSISESSSTSETLHQRSQHGPRRGNERESFASSSSSSSLDARFHYLMSMTAAAGKAFPLHLNLPAPSFQSHDMSTPPHPMEFNHSSIDSDEEDHATQQGSPSSHRTGTPTFATAKTGGGTTTNRGMNTQQSSLEHSESDAELSRSSPSSSSSAGAHNSGEFKTRGETDLPHQHPIAELSERLANLPTSAPFGNLDMSNPPPPLASEGSDSASSIWGQEHSEEGRKFETDHTDIYLTRGEGQANKSESSSKTGLTTKDDTSVKARKGDALFVPLNNGEPSQGTTEDTNSTPQPVSLAEAFRQRHSNFHTRNHTTKELVELRRERLKERRATTAAVEKKTIAGLKVTSRMSYSSPAKTAKVNFPLQRSQVQKAVTMPKPELLNRLASGERAQISVEERRERTRRLYNQLPEVQERKRQEDVLERRRQRLEEMREREKARRQKQRQRREEAQASKVN